MQNSVLDDTLLGFQTSKADTTIGLRDGSHVTGKVTEFDGYVIFLTVGSEQLMVYRHSVLKISGAVVAAPAPVAAVRKESAPDRRMERASARPQKKFTPRPAEERKEREKPKDVVPERLNSMSDEMLKWLNGQKG